MRTLCKKALALCVVFALALTCFVGTLSVSAADVSYDANVSVTASPVALGDTTATAVFHFELVDKTTGINEALIKLASEIGAVAAPAELVKADGTAYSEEELSQLNYAINYVTTDGQDIADDFSNVANLGDFFLSAKNAEYFITEAFIKVTFKIGANVSAGTYAITIDAPEGKVLAASPSEDIINLKFAGANFTVTCDHKYGETVEVTAPTCTAAGAGTQTCSICNDVKDVEIPATGKHAYTYELGNGETHNFTCTVGGETGSEPCAPGEDGVTCVCGYVFVTAPETFTVTFVDADGTVLKTEEVEAGAAATAPELPRKIAYSSNWDVDFSNIVSDTTVTAVYTAAVDTGCGLTGQISLESTFVFTFGIPDANYKGGTVLYAVVNKLYVENGETKYTEEVFEGEDFYAYDGDLCFNYAGIAAKEMTSDVKVRFYFEKDGVLQSSKEVVTCIAKMTLSQMKKTEALRTLGIDMLNYGAAAQIYFKYRQDSLANEYVSGTNSAAIYAEYATKTEPTFTEKTSSTGSWSYGMGMSLDLTLGNTIDMCFYPRVGTYLTDTGKDISTLKLVYEYTSVSGKYYTDSISADKWLEQSADEKLYIFNVLASKDLRVPVTVKIYDDENNLVSKTITTSVAAYAAKLTGADKAAVVAAMFRFSDSAVEYFK